MDEPRLRAAEASFWESIGVMPTERRVELSGGGTVRVQEVGRGEPVVLIHGASNSGTSWASLASRLDGFHCLLVDRPGCGLSDPLDGPLEDAQDLARFSERWVVDLLDGLGLRSADLVATSYGGYSALRTAMTHPDRVLRVVMLGWTMGAPMASVPLLMRIASAPWLGRRLAAMPVNERAVRSMFKRIGLRQALEAGTVSDELVRAYTALLRYTDTMRNEIEVGRYLMSPMKGLNEEILLPPDDRASIRTPLYFLWGDEDPFGTPAIAQDFVAPFPNAQLELMPGAGHAVWVDDPDHAAKVTATFLRG